jgi:hypothetical protein
MGFLNIVAQVQELVDNYFIAMRAFLRAYIDDFICLSKTVYNLEEHLLRFDEHLLQFSELCNELKITLDPKATYPG